MSKQTTPKRPLNTSTNTNTSTTKKTPSKQHNTLTTPLTPHHPSARLTFRPDGSLLPDPNPIKLTSPISLHNNPNHNQQHRQTLSNLTDTQLDAHLLALLTRFFSPLNDENIFTRTLGKLDEDVELEILGDTEGWEFLCAVSEASGTSVVSAAGAVGGEEDEVNGKGKEGQMEMGRRFPREKKIWLIGLYGVFDSVMRGVMRQAGTYT